MDYQYNSQQAVDPAAIHAQKQSKVFGFCDKIGAFFNSFNITVKLMGMAHIFCFILAGIGFTLSLLTMIACGFTNCGIYLPVLTLTAALLAMGARKILPAAIAVSYLGFASSFEFITSIVYFAKYGRYMNGTTVIVFILSLAEFALLILATVFIWKAFADSLPYKPKPVYVAPQQPVQQAAPVAPAAAPAPVQQAAPVAPVAPVAAPAQPAAPVQQAAPAAAPAAVEAAPAPAANVCP